MFQAEATSRPQLSRLPLSPALAASLFQRCMCCVVFHADSPLTHRVHEGLEPSASCCTHTSAWRGLQHGQLIKKASRERDIYFFLCLFLWVSVSFFLIVISLVLYSYILFGCVFWCCCLFLTVVNYTSFEYVNKGWLYLMCSVNYLLKWDLRNVFLF